jgi:hypothetical protein
MLVISGIQRINETSDARMPAVDSSVVEIQTGPSSSRSDISTSSRGGPEGKAV